MDWFAALILGLVEGVTEYLPVSSTGHLLVTQRLLGIPADEAANAFAICIQAGAILAVLLLYGGRVRSALAGIAGRDPAGRRLAIALVVAFLPALIIGGLAGGWFKSTFFGPWPIACAWIAGGLLILALRGRVRPEGGAPLEALAPRQALLIGLAQCVAMIPGTSRSLVTLLAGVGVGLSLAAAVEFSFLLGLLTLTAATVHDALKSGGLMLHEYGWPPLLIGFATACVTAVIAVRWMVSWLHSHGLGVFGWWRLVAGGALVLALLRGWMPTSG
ncbi:MAG TPA: undecaprenyl-diphosphate phosphatase [Planctomycetota bacterium]|nr:undecaprenyl-diphosphate phosphatase [Planctomycetota bacterium]